MNAKTLVAAAVAAPILMTGFAAAPASERAEIEANYRKVATTPQGTYALVDYVNFKGEGVSPSERYQGEGWGLLQVLETLQQTRNDGALMPQFAEAARTVLARRVANAPAERGEQRWLDGWNKRTRTYETPL